MKVRVGCGLQRAAGPPAAWQGWRTRVRGQWCLVSSVEEMGAPGPRKLLFAQAATTSLRESVKEEPNREKMANLLKCGKLRAGETTSSVEEEKAAGPEDMVHAEVKDDPKSLAWVNSLSDSIVTS